ncbi:MAG: cupin [Marinisporobacter sp.]|jgi:quercetin dioxygenase-like cupin family protein|nr:cupin [Marinisporobacter sp.]
MENITVFDAFNKGVLLSESTELDLNKLDWNAHPKLKGVHLKDIITSSETQGTISCHLVKIEPHCKIALHTHPDHLEIHEVIQGQGSCILNTKSHPYNCGIVSIIPKNLKHEVIAGEKGLYLFAKFIPALK